MFLPSDFEFSDVAAVLSLRVIHKKPLSSDIKLRNMNTLHVAAERHSPPFKKQQAISSILRNGLESGFSMNQLNKVKVVALLQHFMVKTLLVPSDEAGRR